MSAQRKYNVEKVAATRVSAEKINEVLKAGNIGTSDCLTSPPQFYLIVAASRPSPSLIPVLLL